MVSSGKTSEAAFVICERRKIAAPRSVYCRDCGRVSWRLFGKGGSAIATPLLSLMGYPGFIAVASPLPATIPGTLVASGNTGNPVCWIGKSSGGASLGGSCDDPGFPSHEFHRRAAFVDRHWNYGARVRPFFFVIPREKRSGGSSPDYRRKIVRPSGGSGWRSSQRGSESYRGFWRMPGDSCLRRPTRGSSGSRSRNRLRARSPCPLCWRVPGTVVHAYLGHISWTVTGLVALGSVPFS